MNAQEIFSTVAQHLLTQKKRAQEYTAEEAVMQCRYRTTAGLKCAIGCLISDDEYRPSMENTNVRSLVVEWGALGWMRPHTYLLIELQRIHDMIEPHYWREELERQAAISGLKMID